MAVTILVAQMFPAKMNVSLHNILPEIIHGHKYTKQIIDNCREPFYS